MKETRRNPVNRCFGNGKSKALPLTERQREEEVKRILLTADEGKKARGRKEVLRALLKKAAKRKRAETLKKVSVKAVPKERDLIREHAEERISVYQKASHDSLIDLLPMVSRKVRQGDEPLILLEVLLKRIRSNQWDKLSFENKCLVIQAESSLEK